DAHLSVAGNTIDLSHLLWSLLRDATSGLVAARDTFGPRHRTSRSSCHWTGKHFFVLLLPGSISRVISVQDDCGHLWGHSLARSGVSSLARTDSERRLFQRSMALDPAAGDQRRYSPALFLGSAPVSLAANSSGRALDFQQCRNQSGDVWPWTFARIERL